jgi:hypothetical protein
MTLGHGTSRSDVRGRTFAAGLAMYGWIGVAIMVASEAGMLLRVEPFWSWHTPIAWTGFILAADAYVFRLRGSSWLTAAPAEFAFLTALSLPLWLIFEWYNANFIHNWYYVNLPEPIALRYFGYVWAFCTIWPAIFECADLVSVLRTRQVTPGAPANPVAQGFRRARPLDWIVVAVGAAFLLWPIVWPSTYLAAPVWLGFIFLLDPMALRLGEESLLADWRAGSAGRLVNLVLSGFACGLLWEFWNYWSRAKWIYTVPILPDVKIFEMPILGFFGFPVFALECFTMYVFTRRLVWRGPRRPVAL